MKDKLRRLEQIIHSPHVSESERLAAFSQWKVLKGYVGKAYHRYARPLK